MPINKDGNGVIVETEPVDFSEFLRTGTVRARSFAIADAYDAVKQIRFDISQLAPNTTLTIQAATGGTIQLDPTAVYITASGSVVLTNKTIDATANTLSNISNTEIKSGAAIALNKLAATTASKALVSDSSGFVSPSTVTSTELGYVSGVTSAIQTQLDTISNNLINFEWQNSVKSATTLTPPGSPATGDRYLIAGTGLGGWSGHDNQIAQWSGSAWVYTNPSVGMFVSADDAPSQVYYYGGSSWSIKYFEATTASTGLTKSGFDIQIDPTAAGNGLGFSAGVLAVNVDNSTTAISADTVIVKDSGVTNAKLANMANNTVKANKSGGSAAPSDLSLSDVVETGSSVLTITNGSKTVITGSNLTIQVSQSTTSTSGYLSSTDWNTFNNKQASGNYITSLTGDVTGSGPGATATTITNLARTKLASGTAYRIVANNSSGVLSENAAITASSAVASDTNGQLVASATTATELGYVSGVTSAIQTQINGKQATGNYITALTGDVTASGPGSVAATIAANAVTNSKLAQMASHTFKGNNTGSNGNALDLTATQATAELNTFVGDSGSGGTKGLVPAPASGDAAANKFLKADGTFTAVASSTVYAWNGYHDTDSTFTRSNSSYGDPTADASSTFTEVINSNFGTVTSSLSAGNKLPGIVFTVPATGFYMVTSLFQFFNNAVNGNAHVRLTDGTTIIGYGHSRNDDGLLGQELTVPVTITGMISLTSGNSKTLSLQTRADGGAQCDIQGDSNSRCITWSIYKIN